MIDRDHSLSVVCQCQLLALSRSSVYYRPMAAPPEELVLIRLIDELHLQFPWMGSRSLRDQINWAGIPISRDRVRSVMGKLSHPRDLPQAAHHDSQTGPHDLSVSAAHSGH